MIELYQGPYWGRPRRAEQIGDLSGEPVHAIAKPDYHCPACCSPYLKCALVFPEKFKKGDEVSVWYSTCTNCEPEVLACMLFHETILMPDIENKFTVTFNDCYLLRHYDEGVMPKLRLCVSSKHKDCTCIIALTVTWRRIADANVEKTFYLKRVKNDLVFPRYQTRLQARQHHGHHCYNYRGDWSW